MNDDWEVKKVSRSGPDYDIRIGPRDSDAGMAEVIGALLMTIAGMGLFGLTGFGLLIFFVMALLFWCFAIAIAAIITVFMLVIWLM